MPFKTLYHRRQSANEVEPLSWYLTDAEELSWVTRIYLKRSPALAKTHLRGLLILHRPGFQQHEVRANYTIVIASGLTPEEERFVAIKELMHIYFGPDGGGAYATSSEVELESLIDEMFVGSTIKSKQGEADVQALWMAMSVLTREKDRRAAEAKLKPMSSDEKNAYIQEVATRWRLTERRASFLFTERYAREVEKLLS